MENGLTVAILGPSGEVLLRRSFEAEVERRLHDRGASPEETARFLAASRELVTELEDYARSLHPRVVKP